MPNVEYTMVDMHEYDWNLNATKCSDSVMGSGNWDLPVYTHPASWTKAICLKGNSPKLKGQKDE
jgi:hypothetical protein